VAVIALVCLLIGKLNTVSFLFLKKLLFSSEDKLRVMEV
jgi:hypothetical protein